MSRLEQKQSWRQRIGWLAGELLVVFAGVSAAFVVENYRDNKKQIAEMHQAVGGKVLPRALSGTNAFYGSDGHLLPAFRVHMDLQEGFAEDLRRIGKMAHDLRLRLEAVQSSK